MRTPVLLAAAAVLLAACSHEVNVPTDGATADARVSAAGATTSDPKTGSSATPEAVLVKLVGSLPDNLKLSADQQAKFGALVSSYEQSTKADRDALEALSRQARDAKAAGKSEADIKKILDQMLPIQQRLAAADAAFATQLAALLTKDQWAWIVAHGPGNPPPPPPPPPPTDKCDPGKLPPLTDAQRTAIQALLDAFQTTNKADLDAVAAANAAAEAAKKAGKSAAEIQAILDAVKPAAQRLEAARAKLNADIDAVLTPAQKVGECRPPLPPVTPPPPPPPKPSCDPAKVPPLTDAQKAQIEALTKAFLAANQADLDAVAAAQRQAEEAKKAGKSPAEVQAILDAVKPAAERLEKARAEYAQQFLSILTPEQKASGCFAVPKP